MRIVRDETSHTTRNRENVRPRAQGVGTRDSDRCKLRAASAPSRPDHCHFKAARAIEEEAVRLQADVRLSDAIHELQAECEGRMATGLSAGRSEMRGVLEWMAAIALMRLARDDRLNQLGLPTIKFSILISGRVLGMVGTPPARLRGVMVGRPFGDAR
jgi:hypothetical protein